MYVVDMPTRQRATVTSKTKDRMKLSAAARDRKMRGSKGFLKGHQGSPNGYQGLPSPASRPASRQRDGRLHRQHIASMVNLPELRYQWTLLHQCPYGQAPLHICHDSLSVLHTRVAPQIMHSLAWRIDFLHTRSITTAVLQVIISFVLQQYIASLHQDLPRYNWVNGKRG